MKWKRIIAVISLLIIVMTGFSIRINEFSYEFKGLVNIVCSK